MDDGNVTDLAQRRESDGTARRGHDPYGGRQKRGSPRGRIARATMVHDAITMLLSGATEHAIADALSRKYERKITPNRVANLLNDQLERWGTEDRSNADRVRELQLRRIDRLESAIWNDALGVRTDGTRKDPSLRAIAEIRKLEALRASIAGTHAPKRIEVAGNLDVAFSTEDFDTLETTWAQSGGDELIIDADVVEPAGELNGG